MAAAQSSLDHAHLSRVEARIRLRLPRLLESSSRQRTGSDKEAFRKSVVSCFGPDQVLKDYPSRLRRSILATSAKNDMSGGGDLATKLVAEQGLSATTRRTCSVQSQIWFVFCKAKS
ncbi:hypothetical protein BWQ96_04416 [Gracilariopsis chorda]|uniref:Uncharacterized protein n=1 Tax=Gracilariopsis chorda TaxID=448386 RepID=A0A2V3IUK4_9FLOR|nr:hypothetical protein BWQ96_04416 [Gracilariopsis chorda]|eukprot:PXF45804.1 hypothetical protein BWQ96_04416 [Gracilariopsis chorda]